MYKTNPEEAQKRADEIIRNTYRTLLTRGMKGCYIYCVDPELEKYLKDRLKSIQLRVKYMHFGNGCPKCAEKNDGIPGKTRKTKFFPQEVSEGKT